MESSYLPPTSLATLPPPGVGPIAFQEAPVTMPHGIQQISSTHEQPRDRLMIRLPWAPSLLPAAFGPALAKALDARWQTYHKQLW